MPSDSTPRMSAVLTHTSRGRRAMRLPTRAQKPRVVGSAEPYCGLIGQKIHRPQMVSSAGSRVVMTSSATAMPMAATGPRLRVELVSANIRHSMPTTTVDALATIAGPARCSATAIASCRSTCRRNSSR